MKTKPVESLQVSDFVAHPVWEFVNDDALGETAVRPVQKLPVENAHRHRGAGQGVSAGEGRARDADPVGRQVEVT